MVDPIVLRTFWIFKGGSVAMNGDIANQLINAQNWLGCQSLGVIGLITLKKCLEDLGQTQTCSAVSRVVQAPKNCTKIGGWALLRDQVTEMSLSGVFRVGLQLLRQVHQCTTGQPKTLQCIAWAERLGGSSGVSTMWLSVCEQDGRGSGDCGVGDLENFGAGKNA